jgi:ferric-dicitrate binding protein FerR (iron transport regulator)
MKTLEQIRSDWKNLYRLSPGEKEDLLQRILQTNAQRQFAPSPRRSSGKWWWAAVAGIVVIAGIGFYLKTVQRQVVQTDITQFAKDMQNVETPNKDISIVLSGSGSIKSINIAASDAKIVHETDGTITVDSQVVASTNAADRQAAEPRQEFAQLIVPDGKHTMLTLEDGSEVWVNAGSRLIYPLAFAKEKREIYIDGEIYIHVTPDKKRPFTVKTNRMDVRVYGTSFNVCAYDKDATQEVVLVQGSVSIKTDGTEQLLSPNQLFVCTDQGNRIEQVNTDDYTLWRYGLYRFNRSTLSSILDRLGRYYGKVLTYDPRVASLTFSGKLDMHESLETLLDGLCYAAPISFVEEGDTAYFIGLK